MRADPPDAMAEAAATAIRAYLLGLFPVRPNT